MRSCHVRLNPLRVLGVSANFLGRAETIDQSTFAKFPLQGCLCNWLVDDRSCICMVVCDGGYFSVDDEWGSWVNFKSCFSSDMICEIDYDAAELRSRCIHCWPFYLLSSSACFYLSMFHDVWRILSEIMSSFYSIPSLSVVGWPLLFPEWPNLLHFAHCSAGMWSNIEIYMKHYECLFSTSFSLSLHIWPWPQL